MRKTAKEIKENKYWDKLYEDEENICAVWRPGDYWEDFDDKTNNCRINLFNKRNIFWYVGLGFGIACSINILKERF